MSFLVVLGASAGGLSARAADQDKSAQLDRLVLDGLADTQLQFEGVNAILSVGFFGESLKDAAFGRRACDGVYPAEKRRAPRSERLEAARDYAREIAARVVSSTTELPAREGFPRQEAASFARLVGEFRDAGDLNAIERLRSSPEFVSFLLDPSEPGYCRRVPLGSEEDRVSRASELAGIGIRRLERTEPDFVTLYLYRPRRLVGSLQGAVGDWTLSDTDVFTRRLADYADRMASLERFVREKRDTLAPYSFPEKSARRINILDDLRNSLPSGLKYEVQMNMPIEMGMLRRDFAEGRRRPSFDAERWRALELIAASCPALVKAQDFFVLRIVTDPAATAGRFVWDIGDDRVVGVSIQLAALDRVARIDPKNRRALRRELDFFSEALAAAQSRQRSRE